MAPLSLMLGTLFSCIGEHQTKKTAPDRSLPNIIWLVIEDQSPEFFPMYGDSTISLPHLESLAQDGVTFTNAVSPAPVCAPARSALITGMYPTTLGTHNMRTYTAWRKVNEPLLDSLPSYSPVVPEGVKMFPEYLRKVGYYTSNGPKEDYNFEKTDAAWNESSNTHHFRNRPEGAPFFSVFNFGVCHESGIWHYQDSTLHVSPSEVAVPPYFPDTPVVRHDLAVDYSNLKRMDDQIGEIIADLKEDGLYENSIIFFYSDHGGPFPRHKRALYDTGVKVPLIIKFPQNKGAGSFDDRQISFIDFAPTVLSMAGMEPPKVMQGVAHFGKYKTIAPPKYTYHASDRFDEIYDRVRAVRSPRFKYIRSYYTELPHALPISYREQMPMMQEMRKLYKEGKLNAEQAFWFNTPRPKEELYDLRKDPYELENLASRVAWQDTLEHYRKLLDEWVEETNDLGHIPERELMAQWFPDGKQPKLPPLELEERNDSVRLICKKPDATIVWKRQQDSVWNVYTKPLPNNLSFEAKAERIGYQDSDILQVFNNQ